MIWILAYLALVVLSVYMLAKEWGYCDNGSMDGEEFFLILSLSFIPVLGISIGVWGMGERAGKARKEREKKIKEIFKP